MSEDAKAKIRLKDGREVWRKVTTSYREVASGRWISAQEVEKLLPEGWAAGSSLSTEPRPDLDDIRRQIVDVQSQIALDKQSGAKSTSAARLVLKALSEMEKGNLEEEQNAPWFILGRELAEQVLQLIDEEKEKKSRSFFQV